MEDELETKDLVIDANDSQKVGSVATQLGESNGNPIFLLDKISTTLEADIDTEPQQIFATTELEMPLDYSVFENKILQMISSRVIKSLELNDLRNFGVKEEMIPFYYSNWKYKLITDTIIYNCNINDVIFNIVLQNADSSPSFFANMNYFLRSNTLQNLYNTIPNTSLNIHKFHFDLFQRLHKIRSKRLNLNSI